MSSPIELVECGYQRQTNVDAWISALAPLINSAADRDAIGWVAIRVGRDGPDHIYGHSLSGAEDEIVLKEARKVMAAGDPLERLANPIAQALGMQGMYSTVETAGRMARGENGERVKVVDTHSVVMHCAQHTVVFVSLARGIVRIDASERALWRRITAHLSAGCRLSGRQSSPDAGDVTAVLRPGGHVLNAIGAGKNAETQERLRHAARLMDQARTRKSQADPERALELWSGLVCGRWSLVDHFESDGKRFILARENAPKISGSAKLTVRQRQVLFYVGAGWSNKEVAYALGLSESTVAVHLKSALAAMRLRSRADWIALDTRLALAAGQSRAGFEMDR